MSQMKTSSSSTQINSCSSFYSLSSSLSMFMVKYLPIFSTKRSKVQDGSQIKSLPNSNSPESKVVFMYLYCIVVLCLSYVCLKIHKKTLYRLWPPSCQTRWDHSHWGLGDSPGKVLSTFSIFEHGAPPSEEHGTIFFGAKLLKIWWKLNWLFCKAHLFSIDQDGEKIPGKHLIFKKVTRIHLE